MTLFSCIFIYLSRGLLHGDLKSYYSERRLSDYRWEEALSAIVWDRLSTSIARKLGSTDIIRGDLAQKYQQS